MEKPILFDPEQGSIEDFKKTHGVEQIFDTFESQLRELYLIRNPRFRFSPYTEGEWQDFLHEYLSGEVMEQKGFWFYFPWNKNFVHYLPEDEHLEVRTARNRNIITSSEQDILYNSTLAFLGLSVGSHAVLTLVMMGIGKRIYIADPDTISASNLNRIRADVADIGLNKCDFILRKIYQINPYLEIMAYREGAHKDNLVAFLNEPSRAQILIEEVDNLEIKIRSRLAARACGMPVVMATDNGDNVIVDVERYDIDNDLELFNGAIGPVTIEEFEKFSPHELPRLATKIAGPRLITGRMQDSLLEVGKTIYSWPQMGNAATLAGVALSYLVKRILLGGSAPSGKYEVNLDAIFDPGYHTSYGTEQRDIQLNNFLKTINLDV